MTDTSPLLYKPISFEPCFFRSSSQRLWFSAPVKASQMDSYTLSTLIVGVVLMTKVLWELQFSPLARQHIPGPKWAAISDLWTYWLMIRRRRTSTYDRLFGVRVLCLHHTMNDH